jgi:hypothetical protein
VLRAACTAPMTVHAAEIARSNTETIVWLEHADGKGNSDTEGRWTVARRLCVQPGSGRPPAPEIPLIGPADLVVVLIKQRHLELAV